MADSIRQHIDSSLSILQQYSLYADKVDWKKVKQNVFYKARNAKTKAETFSALKIAFDALGDKHAVYYQYEDAYRINNTRLMDRYNDSIRSAWSRGPGVDAIMIGNIAYIKVPYMGAKNQEQINWYANWLYDSIASLQKEEPAGWVIDLRLNGGGNIRPMMAGLAMFFNDGVVSFYIDKDGKASDEAAFGNGDFLIDSVKQAFIKNKISACPDAKMAVLIGPGTASSGEIVAAVLASRTNTLLLGDSTAGLANATNGFVFNENQNYFLISTARIANQYKIPFPETIYPHFFIKGNDAFNDIAHDIVVKQAIQWLLDD